MSHPHATISDMALGIGSQTWGTIAAWATLVVISASALFALRQLGEARRLRQAQTRPFVIVDFEPGFLINLLVTNIGSTVARNVRIAFDPPLESTLGERAGLDELAALRDGIPTLVPGRELRFLFDTAHTRLSSDLTQTYRVTLNYDDHDNLQLAPETSILDLRPLEGSRLPPPTLEDLLKPLKEIQRELSRWTDGLSGIKVVDRSAETVEWEARRRGERAPEQSES